MDEIDLQNQRTQELFDELLKCPVEELCGIVSPGGVCGTRSRGKEDWSLSLSFDAWRISAGQVRTESLSIHKNISEEELHKLQSLIDAETVIQIRARVAEENVCGTVQAYFEEYRGIAENDQELQARLLELQKPKIFNDDRFGVFTFDRLACSYIAHIEWVGHEVDLTLNAEPPEEIEQCLINARVIWDDKESWNTRVAEYAVRKLLPLKNDCWLDDDESEFSPEVFKSKMKLESIAIWPDGDFEFWHNDGDMFYGHAIEISGNLEEGPNNADIPG